SITANYDSTTEKLTLTGSDTFTHYQQVLDSVTFTTPSDDPDNAGADPTRSVTWTVVDNSGGANNTGTATSTIGITAINEPPFLHNVTPSDNYTENGAPITLSPSLFTSDVDGGNGGNGILLSATVKIASGFVAGDELLVYDTTTNTASTQGL